METKTRRMIVYICAIILIVIGLYNLIILKDTYIGIIWTLFGIIFLILGYIKLKT